ncbi:SACS-like protein [Mya arenaria]|uniref:SACS-like protein n=1 Tax=Mya arenaria TaxID=6604 RepID=A0ABY7EXC7_MYAAR|nr:SACS-like protein [Mya arenaria]
MGEISEGENCVFGDSDSGSDAEYAGIEQPPIIDQLRRILDEYRNDVQIIKELVQNADDAGASELRVLYQGETFNHEPPTRGDRFRKFFKTLIASNYIAPTVESK